MEDFIRKKCIQENERYEYRTLLFIRVNFLYKHLIFNIFSRVKILFSSKFYIFIKFYHSKYLKKKITLLINFALHNSHIKIFDFPTTTKKNTKDHDVNNEKSIFCSRLFVVIIGKSYHFHVVSLNYSLILVNLPFGTVIFGIRNKNYRKLMVLFKTFLI